MEQAGLDPKNNWSNRKNEYNDQTESSSPKKQAVIWNGTQMGETNQKM